jgi:guanylate kinase
LNNRGTLFIISGPSGAGKGTVLGRVMQNRDDLFVSISATTRQPREGEVDGVNYYFVSKKRFEEMIAAQQVLEYACYCGNYYGTPLEAVEQRLAQGMNVILEIEVVGAAKVKTIKPDAVSIFITPPSMQVLEKRLRDRGTETEEVIRGRLDTARREIQEIDKYDYIVINDELETAVGELETIIDSQRYRAANRSESIKGGF